jgi:hypothetical protein
MSAIQTPTLLASIPKDEPEEMSLDGVRQANIPCAICIIQDEIHDMLSTVRYAIYGTMRCHHHTLQCASCHGEVETDTQLLCEGCSYSGVGAVYSEILLSSPPPRMCLFEFVENRNEHVSWACGCPTCMQETAQFYLARSIEEGYSEYVEERDGYELEIQIVD